MWFVQVEQTRKALSCSSQWMQQWKFCSKALLNMLTCSCCCNLSSGIALKVWFTKNRMWTKDNNIYTCREQAIIEWRRWAISIVACCHGAKLCAHATQDFWSQQNGAVPSMWRSCRVQPSHKEHAIGVVHCKKVGMLLQPLHWCCVGCLIHHERDVREEQDTCGTNKQ